MEALLAADYGVTVKAAPIAAQNFIETIEFAGLVREGKLVFPESGDTGNSEKKELSVEKIAETKKNSLAIKIKLSSGIEILFPEGLAYRLSMGEFAQIIKNLEDKASAV